MRVPWTARRSNQSILKKITPEHSLEGLMLKLQYFGHLMQRADSLEKTLRLGKTKGYRRGWERLRCSDGITDSMSMSLSKFWGLVMDRQAWRCCGPWGYKESDMTDQLNNKAFKMSPGITYEYRTLNFYTVQVGSSVIYSSVFTST